MFRKLLLLLGFTLICSFSTQTKAVNYTQYSKDKLSLNNSFIASVVLSSTNETIKQLDLLTQVNKYNLLIRILHIINLILFLIVLIIIIISIRIRLKGRKELLEKNNQIKFFNERLVEKNAQLEHEVKRRIEESVYELTQREVVVKQLKESDQKYSNAFYFSPELLIIVNSENGIVVDANESFLKFFNLLESEVVDKHIFEIQMGISRFSLTKLLSHLTTSSSVNDFKLVAKSITNSELWLSVSSVKMKINLRDCFYIVLKETTNEHRLAEDYKSIQGKYNLISYLSNDFIWCANLDFKYEFVSDSAHKLFGYSWDDLIGKPHDCFMSQSSQKRINERISSLLKLHANNLFFNENNQINEQVEFINKEGKAILYEYRAYLVQNLNNELVRLEGVCYDISEKVHENNTNLKKIHFYETIVDSLNDIVFWFDKNRELTYVTSSVKKFLGYNPEELYELPFNNVMTEKSTRKIEQLVQFIRGKYDLGTRKLVEDLDSELDFIAKNGNIKTGYIQSRLFYDENYQFQGFVSTVKDISSEKEMIDLNRKSEKYFKKLFNESPVMMIIADEKDMIIDANAIFLITIADFQKTVKNIKLSSILVSDEYKELSEIKSDKDFLAKLILDEENVLDVLVKKADFTDEENKQTNLYVLRDVTLQLKAEQERTIRENQFIAISENSKDIIIRYNKSIECIYVNPAFYKDFKLSIDSIEGLTPKTFILDTKVGNYIYDSCISVLVSEKELMIEYSLLIDDKITYYQNRIVPEFDMYGKVNTVISISSNVTEFVSAIQSLKVNIEQIAFLNQIIAVCNRASTTDELFGRMHEVFVSKYFKIDFAVSLYKEDTKQLKLVYNTLNEEIKYQINEYFSNAELQKDFYKNLIKLKNEISSRKSAALEFKIYDTIEKINVIPILSKDEILGFVFFSSPKYKPEIELMSMELEKSIAQEVGSSLERILAEQKHIESSEEYRMLVETTSDLVWRINEDFNFTFVSSKSETLLGYISSDLLNHSIYDIIHESKRNQIIQFIEFNRKSLEMISFYDLPLIHKRGNLVYVELNAYPLVDENGRFIGYSGINRDITTKKLNEELRRSKEIAEGMSKVKQQFIDNISHEIRTPLNAIIGLTEVLSKNYVSDEQNKYIDSIQKNGRSLLGLINDVLDMSRIDSGRFQLNKEAILTPSFFSDLFLTFQIQANTKQLTLEFDIDPLVPDVVLIDELRLKQVLVNLISNSIKFTETGFVKLTVDFVPMNYQDNKIGLIIHIIDSGIGISTEDQEIIWESFMQSHGQSTRKYGGSGLGLGISKKIIETMKGTISLESTLDKGSDFKIVLPEIEVLNQEISENAIFEEKQWYLLGISDKHVAQFNAMFKISTAKINILNDPSKLPLFDSNIESKGNIIIISAIYFFEKQFYSILKLNEGRIIVFGEQNKIYPSINIAHVIILNFSKFNILEGIRKLDAKNFSKQFQRSFNGQNDDDDVPVNSFEQNEIVKFICFKADIMWNSIKNTNSINDINHFALTLQEYGKEHKIKNMIDYSDNLLLAIKTFDIAKINQSIDFYPELKTKLKSAT